MRFPLFLTAGIASIGLLLPQVSNAQGLIWSLPEDGTSMQWFGTYKQTEERAGSDEGPQTIQWNRQLTIKSVGKETAEFRGRPVPCRWIEIKVVTGKPSSDVEGGTDAGLIGARIYRVLVPEGQIYSTTVDSISIPVSFLPIVKGYRRFGEQEIQPIKSKVLQVYPLLAMLRSFRDLKSDATGVVDPGVELGPVSATHLTGTSVVESPTIRSKNTTDLWQSKDVPFGLAKWKVTITRETKNISDPRTAFKLVSSIEVEMGAQKVDTQAEPVLVLPVAEN